MNKAIKSEIIKHLKDKNPPAEWQRLIMRYMDEIAGSETAVILRCRYFLGFGFWRTIRILEKHGFYMSQTVFYDRLSDAISELAMRAAYERLICPYCMERGANEK